MVVLIASDEVIAALPAASMVEEVVRYALALGAVSERQVIAIELRRLEAGVALTEREFATALRLSDELEDVRDDWRQEPPIRVRDLIDEVAPTSLRLLLLLQASALAEQLPDGEENIWELESLFNSLDVDDIFAGDRFFASEPSESSESSAPRRAVDGIRLAILREARRLADE